MFKKKKEAIEKSKITRTMKVGTHKRIVIGFWLLLIASISFGIYKNFTAIDQHTTHEVETIELRLYDTNSIEGFVEKFVKVYYTWDNNKENLERRTENINQYMTKDLQALNVDTIRSDIPTSSKVTDVKIWSVKQSGDNDYIVTYEVEQEILENGKSNSISEVYALTIYVDNNSGMVVIKNPTPAANFTISNYEPKILEVDGSVDAETTQDAISFLETFFKLYPNATTQELSYYVRNNALPAIEKDNIKYSKILETVITCQDNNLDVMVTVEYLNQNTKATIRSQYDITLHKGDNWMITASH